MKNWKKIMGLVLVTSLAASSLAACGQKAEEAPAPAVEEESEEVEEEAEEAEEAVVEDGTSEVKMSQLDAEALKAIQDKIDAQYAHDLIYKWSQCGNVGNDLGFRNAGSTGEAQVRAMIKEEMEAIGLQNVEELPFDVDAWEFTDAGITTSDGTEIELSSVGGSVGLDEDLTTEIVWVNAGTAADFDEVDVEGKIALIEFDNMLGYWFSAPQYEAELRGAKAIVCSTRSDLNNINDDGMLVFDGGLRTTIPVLSISKNNCAALKELIEAGDSTVTLKADITVKPGKSANLIGYIPGKNPDHMISIGAHMDGWYHSFQDDLYGIGMWMAIAKAMIETGYQPEYSIAFIGFCAEEYGVADTVFDDWCTGVWSLVTQQHPEWCGKNLAHFEIDSVRPDTDTYTLNITPELQGFFEAYASEVDESAMPAQFVNGISVVDWAGPWSQDYSFTRTGIPGISSRQSKTPWKIEKYHTQFDDESAWNEELFNFHAKEYTQWLYTFDNLALAPFDFGRIVNEVKGGLDTTAVAGTDIEANYCAALDRLEAVAATYYEDVKQINQLYLQLVQSGKTAEDLAELREMIDAEFAVGMEAYRIIEDEFVGMDQWQTVIYKDLYTAINYGALAEVKAALEAGDVDSAIGPMYSVDTTYLTDFSREVYEYVGITGVVNSKMWAKDKMTGLLDTYDLMMALFSKGEGDDLTDVIAMVDDLMAEELEIITEVYTDGADQLNRTAETLEGSCAKDIIAAAEAMLN